MKFKSIAAILTGFLLTGCVNNQPATLSSLEVQDATGKIVGHPLYERTDAFSFSTAITKYPANGGQHKIPVGQYLLYGVMNVLPADVSKLRLKEFDSECRPVGAFLPQVSCTTTYALSMVVGGNSKDITGRTVTDVGSLYVKDDQLILGVAGYRDYGDNTILGQVRRALDQTLDDVKRQLTAAK